METSHIFEGAVTLMGIDSSEKFGESNLIQSHSVG